MSSLVLFHILSNVIIIYGNNCVRTLTNKVDKRTVICDNNCNSCTITCNGADVCKEGKLYSGALNTIVTCQGVSACDNAKLYIGYFNDIDYPNGYNVDDFYQNQYESFQINCKTEKSCIVKNINVYGNFIYGGNIDASGSGPDRLYDARVTINLQYRMSIFVM